MRTTQTGPVRAERLHRAVGEIRQDLVGLYRAFVAWASLYEDVREGDERERRERVAGLLEELSNGCLPRSVWLTEATRRKVEAFLRRSGDLLSELSAEVEERGCERAGMARRVSKKLGPLKKDLDSDLGAELAPARRAGWRGRLRRP